MTETPYDPRAIANLMLDEAERNERELSHLPLQKLLYFAHGLFLVEQKQPLVSGYFEAWQRGPVHPLVYQAFKGAGRNPIRFRAQRQNIITGEHVPIPPPASLTVRAHVTKIMAQYGNLPPGLLVTLSHAKGGPWDFALDKDRTRLAFGLRINNDVISSRFKHHKISVRHPFGDPGEDTPPA